MFMLQHCLDLIIYHLNAMFVCACGIWSCSVKIKTTHTHTKEFASLPPRSNSIIYSNYVYTAKETLCIRHCRMSKTQHTLYYGLCA